jgi:hypothetical protein
MFPISRGLLMGPHKDRSEVKDASEGIATRIASREAVETRMIGGEAEGTASRRAASSLSETTSTLDAANAGRAGGGGSAKAGEPSGKEGMGAPTSSLARLRAPAVMNGSGGSEQSSRP